MNMTNLRQALFRCDASKLIGIGHVMRCLTLADALKVKGYQCSFMSSPETMDMVPLLREKYPILSPDQLDHQPTNCDIVIFDHYRLDARDEQTLRDKFSASVMVIDDMADRPHDCAILLDQTYGRAASDYQSLVPSTAKLLMGVEYALLRDQFAQARTASCARRDITQGEIKRVFVFMGGADPDNVTLKVLQAFQENSALASLQVDFILGQQAAERMKMKEAIASHPNMKLHINVQNMAELMAAADLAIGAGGTTSWERCCLGLPTITIEIADNQKLISANLDQAGAIKNLGWHENISSGTIGDAIFNFMANKQASHAMSRQAAKICDGRGAQRVVEAIDNVLLK